MYSGVQILRGNKLIEILSDDLLGKANGLS